MSNKTYAGIPEEYSGYKNAKVVILPVPYDGTSTWGKGADKGPQAFLDASENMEIYDLESDTEVHKHGIWLSQALNCDKNPEIMAQQVKAKAKKFYEDNKLFTMIGGEHSVSIGAIMASAEKFENLSVLQLDAHSDLRAEYEGTAYNHACALHWASKNTNLVQVGIRSMAIEEKEFVKKENVFFAEDIANRNNWQQEVIDKLGENVYLTIDLDYFDPSILPATGTPEPGGLTWYPSLELLKKLAQQKKIIGFDIVELAPDTAHPASNFLAAKLYYKILTYILEK
ncbi:MAG: agmatinase [Bacteroidales bacterium]|jgi:agmatinase|nr:agmatinase [Bacteroidales bacterium]MCK9499489.1 agmatinase [Bacteroidales bacterium]MDY0313969.1 agmatinase [Bacteroidales bacterium]NLB86004.1 agmatinase [Bacteroidales bacterium]